MDAIGFGLNHLRVAWGKRKQGPPELPKMQKRKTAAEIVWGSSGKETQVLIKFRRLLGPMKSEDCHLLLQMARKMAAR